MREREVAIAGTAPGAREAAALRLLVPLAYLSMAVLFMVFYTARARWMPRWGIEGLTYAPPFPFRYRFLSTLLPALAARWMVVPLEWSYAVQGTLCVWGALLCFRAVLAQFVRRDLAAMLAPGLLYGLTWHYAALNSLYFPFDMPAVFLFTACWLLLLRRRWRLYYPVFVLAVLNRETALMLPVLVALVWRGRMPARALAGHVAAQALVWLGLKAALWLTYGHAGPIWIGSLATNGQTVVEVLRMQGRGPKTVAKVLLWCGGLWAVLPFVARTLPTPLRRSLWVVVPFVAVMVFVGTLREMRIYAELIPVVSAAALIGSAYVLVPRMASDEELQAA